VLGRSSVTRTRVLVLLCSLAMLAASCSADDSTDTTTTTEAGSTTTEPAAGETTTTEPAPSEGDDGQILRLWSSQEFEPVFHPVQACCAQEIVHELIFNQLVGVDEDSQTVIPELATQWEVSPDATEFTFTIADGVEWHDGTPFTAEDIVWTANWTVANFEAYGAFAPVWPQILGADAVTDGSADAIEGIEIVDSATVKIVLAAPNAEFLAKLAEPPNTIMPRHILEGETAATIRQSDFATGAPVGTGPYTLVQVLPDQYVELAANADYFKGAPSISRLFYMLYGPDAALGALETGELDVALNIDPREMERLSTVDGLAVASIQTAGMVRIELKNEAPPFDDVRVRQAAYYAIDRRALCEQVLDGLCTPLHVNPGFMQYSGLNDYPFDPERARELLDEAGYDGQIVRIMWDSGVAVYNTIFAIVGQQLEDVGFSVEMQPTETNLWIDRLRFQRDTWEGYVNTGGSELISPDNSAVYFQCDYEGERGKWQTGYENCDLDQLFVDGRQTGDPAERDAIYQQIAEILNEDVPAIHLWAPHNVYAATDALGGGFGVAPNDTDSFNDVETWTLAN
jgi:ABC-type transport system substrate-binding protein